MCRFFGNSSCYSIQKRPKPSDSLGFFETHCGFDFGCRGSSGELGMSGNQRPVFLQSPSPEIAVVTSSVTNLIKNTKRLSVLQVFLSSRSGRFAANEWY